MRLSAFYFQEAVMEELEKTVDKQEETVPQDDDMVTDEQLEAAYAAISGKDEVKPVEEKKEEPAVEAKTEEPPVVNPEFKAFQERIDALVAENEKLKGVKPAVEEPVAEDDEETFVTSKNLDEVLTKREQAKQRQITEANAVYQRSYEASLAQLAATVDKEVFPEIFETMLSNNGQNEFNQRPTGNASADAKINFVNAKAHVFMQKAGKPTPRLSETKTDLPTGITVNNRDKATEQPTYQFDEHAQALLKNSGLTDAEIKEAMEGPTTFMFGRKGM